MKNRIIVSLILIACLNLVSCGSLIKVHRLDIQQGNILTQEDIQKIKVGMSQEQVTEALGQPVLTQSTNNQLTYVYTWQPGYGKFTQQHLILYFKGNRLINYRTNIPQSKN